MAPRWVWPYDFYLGPIARKCFLPFFFSNIPQPPSSNFPTYHWESILLSVISVYSHNNFCWSLLRGSQIVPLFAVILNQLRNKTKERKADGRKMSHVLSLVVQIPLTAPKFVLSLWDHISQALVPLDHISCMAVFSTMACEWRWCFYCRPGPYDFSIILLDSLCPSCGWEGRYSGIS